MSRTVTIHDDESGVTTTVTILSIQDVSIVRSITIACDTDRGVRAADLATLESFGLIAAGIRPPPTPPAPARAARTPKPSARLDAAKGRPIRKKAGARVRYPRPPDAQFVADYHAYKGHSVAIAQKYGVPQYIIWSWTSRVRAKGLLASPNGRGTPAIPPPSGDIANGETETENDDG